MELTVLGMNGPFPAANGATSGYLMRGEKTRVAMDMGSGTLGRLTALMPPEKLDALLLSHWHFDHCSDVLPLLFRLQACAAKPLDVYAPVDESSMVRKVVQQSGALSACMTCKRTTRCSLANFPCAFLPRVTLCRGLCTA